MREHPHHPHTPRRTTNPEARVIDRTFSRTEKKDISSPEKQLRAEPDQFSDLF
jgi:hypothetical protein